MKRRKSLENGGMTKIAKCESKRQKHKKIRTALRLVEAAG